MLMNKLDFIDWVNAELENAKVRRTELAKIGGIDQGYVSHVLNKESKPGLAFCQAVAKALNIPETDVLWRAGMSRERPLGVDQPGMYEIVEAAKKLTDEQRQQAIILLELLKDGLVLVPKDNPKSGVTANGKRIKAKLEVDSD